MPTPLQLKNSYLDCRPSTGIAAGCPCGQVLALAGVCFHLAVGGAVAQVQTSQLQPEGEQKQPMGAGQAGGVYPCVTWSR